MKANKIKSAAACLDDLISGTLSGEDVMVKQIEARGHVERLYAFVEELESRSLPSHFTTELMGVKLCVTGEYDAPDISEVTNWPGGFEVERVWVEADPSGTDIFHLLTDSARKLIEHEGFKRGGEKEGFYK